MWKKNLIRTIAAGMCLLTLVLLVFSMPAASVEAASLSQLQSNLSSLKEEQKKIDAQLAHLKKEASSQKAYQAELEKKISNAQGQLDNLLLQISGLDENIAQKEIEISNTQQNIDADYTKLKERIRVLYMMGEVSVLEILLSAESVGDYFSREEFVKSITLHDNAILEDLKEHSAEVQAEKEQIEQDRAQLAEAKTEYDAQLAQLEAAKAESKRIAAQIQHEQAQAQQEAAKLAKKRAEADAAIEKWWKDYYAAQANKNQIQSTGSFMWPMPGYSSKSNITQYFGGPNGHRGIDISGANIYGKAIVAADSGLVANTSYNDYIYGIYLTIDHGKGVATLYGHCSGLAVKKGATVKKGQTIAYVGSSGVSTGAHLHFGVLINGVAVDPAQYFNLK